MADVFISYKTETTLDLVRDTICPAIEAAGISCWYAARDGRPGMYGGHIKRAIGACRVFLLILDEGALHAAHVKSETALAFRRLNEGERITLLPFRVDGCRVRDDDDLDYMLVCHQIMDGRPPDAGHVRALVSGIRKVLDAPL